MAGASDKARFFLEQSVPELKEFERKRIFTPAEITSIASKRSDFEHKINARGSTPSDYARYAEYEINLDALRRKRVKRLGIKATAVAHTGPRRIFFILDRGTKKFPGDVGLWVQSIEFAKAQKAHKRLSQILTNVLRLHPTKSELWIWAARFSMEEQADIIQARSYMQRGLRFCKRDKHLWLEFAKLELSYIGKIVARRRILGITGDSKEGNRQLPRDTEADVLFLSEPTADDIRPDSTKQHEVDEGALRRLESTPALNGAIPIAIFDAAMQQFSDDADLALAFFNLVTEFDQLPCRHRILEHIAESMRRGGEQRWQVQACWFRLPIMDMAFSSPELPGALGLSLDRLKSGLAVASNKRLLVENARAWTSRLLEEPDMDGGLRKIIRSQARSLEKIPMAE